MRGSITPARDEGTAITRPVRAFGIQESVPGAEVVVTGSLDVHTVPDVRTLVSRVLTAGSGALVLDVHEAEIGDATGLGVLVGAHHRANRAGRTLVLRGPSARMMRLLRATKLNRVLLTDDVLAGHELPA